MEKEILPLIYRPGHIFWDLHITFKGLDAFFRCYNILTKAGLEILDIHLSRSIEEGKIVFLVDATKSKVSIEMLYEEIKNVFGVADVFIKDIPTKGFGYHLIHPYQLGPHKVVILTDLLLSTLVNSIKDQWGSAGEFALYRIGESVGNEIYSTLHSIYNVEGKDLVTIILMMHEVMGWTERTELLEYNTDEKARVRIYNNIECKHVKRNKPNSQFIRGILAGIFKQIFSKDIEVEETHCLSKGDKYCQFIIRCK